MTWENTRSRIIVACGTSLEPHGYKLVKSRDAFEKSSASERRGVYLTLIASSHGNYSLRLWCGIRNNQIEELFHRTSGVDKKHRANYTTLNLNSGQHWWLNSDDEIHQALAQATRFITETAIPFLERDYSISDYSRLLNSNPSGRCPYHGNTENRYHYGLIAAKLIADPAYQQLKALYADILRATNKGFYYPRFARLVADLESVSIQHGGSASSRSA